METLFFVVAGLFLAFGFVAFLGAPYVPVKLNHVRQAFTELYPLTPDDMVLDLGSGDGKVLREVARRGGSAVGYEINPILVVISNLLGRKLPRQRARVANIWTTPFPATTSLVYVFTDSRDAKRIARRVQAEAERLGRPIHVLSYGFALPGLRLVKKNRLHYLYVAKPLQVKKPQV